MSYHRSQLSCNYMCNLPAKSINSTTVHRSQITGGDSLVHGLRFMVTNRKITKLNHIAPAVANSPGSAIVSAKFTPNVILISLHTERILLLKFCSNGSRFSTHSVLLVLMVFVLEVQEIDTFCVVYLEPRNWHS